MLIIRFVNIIDGAMVLLLNVLLFFSLLYTFNY